MRLIFSRTFKVRANPVVGTVLKLLPVFDFSSKCQFFSGSKLCNIPSRTLAEVETVNFPPPRGRGTPYIGLYGEAPPERGTFFRLQVHKRVGISQVEVYKRVGKSVVSQREVNK